VLCDHGVCWRRVSRESSKLMRVAPLHSVYAVVDRRRRSKISNRSTQTMSARLVEKRTHRRIRPLLPRLVEAHFPSPPGYLRTRDTRLGSHQRAQISMRHGIRRSTNTTSFGFTTGTCKSPCRRRNDGVHGMCLASHRHKATVPFMK